MARLAAALLLCAGVATANDPPLRAHSDPRGRFELSLPSNLDVEVAAAQQSEWSLDLLHPASGAKGTLSIYSLPGMLGARSQAYREREELDAGDARKLSAVVALEPLPHLIVRRRRGEEIRVQAIAYRVIRGNGLSLSLWCAEGDWGALRAGLLTAARTLEGNLAPWPPRPAGYEAEMRDGYLYLVHPQVRSRDVRAFHRLLKRQEKRYARVWGPVVKTDDRRPGVVFSPSAYESKKIEKAVGRSGFFADLYTGRLFAVPLPDGDVRGVADAVRELFQFFHLHRFGGRDPRWVMYGESRLLWQEEYTGKRLPYVTAGQLKDLVNLTEPFGKLAEYEHAEGRWSRFLDLCDAYVALFRAGPRPYRKAYAAFRKELLETGDWKSAAGRHILALDQDELARALAKFVTTRLKTAPKRR